MRTTTRNHYCLWTSWFHRLLGAWEVGSCFLNKCLKSYLHWRSHNWYWVLCPRVMCRRSPTLSTKVQSPGISVSICINCSGVILTSRDIADLARLEESFTARAYWCKLMFVAEIIWTSTMNTVTSVSSWVNIARCWKCKTEIFTTADLNNSTGGWLERNMSHC